MKPHEWGTRHPALFAMKLREWLVDGDILDTHLSRRAAKMGHP